MDSYQCSALFEEMSNCCYILHVTSSAEILHLNIWTPNICSALLALVIF